MPHGSAQIPKWHSLTRVVDATQVSCMNRYSCRYSYSFRHSYRYGYRYRYVYAASIWFALQIFGVLHATKGTWRGQLCVSMSQQHAEGVAGPDEGTVGGGVGQEVLQSVRLTSGR